MDFAFDAHEIQNFDFDDDDDLTIKGSEISDFLNEEDEYDAINDETFGGCVSALLNDNLEEFVDQVVLKSFCLNNFLDSGDKFKR